MTAEYYEKTKHPDSEIDYGRIWAEFLQHKDGTKATVVTSTWVVTSKTEAVPTLTISAKGEGILQSIDATYLWLIGGTDGVKYEIENTMTDSTGRTEVKTGTLLVKVK